MCRVDTQNSVQCKRELTGGRRRGGTVPAREKRPLPNNFVRYSNFMR